jgi:general secretion pathway protein C
MTRRRQGIVLASLTVSTFLAAHLLNAFVSQALTGPMDDVARSAPSTKPAQAAAAPGRLAEEILNAPLFASLRAPGASINLSGPSEMANAHPLDAAKKIRLMGTVVGDGLSALAILEDLRTKRQLLYHLHDRVPEVGQIVEIHNDAVVIQEGQQRETLELAFNKIEQPVATPPGGASATAGAGRPTGSQITLDRRVITQSVADLPKLLSQAQASPYYNVGKLEGWRIDALKPDSFYDKIGLQIGDVLQRVNGVDIRDPGMMLTLFQQLKDERQVKLDLLRKDQRTTLNYDIR